MIARYVIGPLDRQWHDRSTFASGVEVLDSYLKERASQEIRKRVAAVYVLCEQDSRVVIGYYTVSTASIETTRLPEELTKRLPRYDAMPAMPIGRLAVDGTQQGKGLGELLIADALQRCLRLSQEIGAIAVLIDAKEDRVALYYERFGFRRFEDAPLRLFMPMQEIRDLS